MGYVDAPDAVAGNAVTIEVRGKELPATVAALPFVPHRYFRKPTDLTEETTMTTRYTRDHEWIRLDGDLAVVGITDYAQEQLGDIVYVELPETGQDAREGRRILRRRVGQGGERGVRADRRRGASRSTARSATSPAPSTSRRKATAG